MSKCLHETTVSCNNRFMDEPLDRREVLLEKIVDVLLANGISGLSLRPLADSVGSSARLLIYHFGSKEELLAFALERVRSRIETAVGELMQKENGASLEEFLRRFWKWAIQEPNQRYFRLLFEIDGLAMHKYEVVPAKDRIAGVNKWIRIFEGKVDKLVDTPEGRRGASTIILSAITGLLHDYYATGDLKRTTAGLNFLIELLSNQSSTTTHKTKMKGRLHAE
jgi:AcrR family transcriptional regulator